MRTTVTANVTATVRAIVWLGTGAALLSLASASGAWGQQHAAGPAPASAEPSAQSAVQTSSQGEQAGAPSTAPKQDSLAEAARKAREQKKDSKPAKVFTNDNLPTEGGISTVGAEQPAAASDTSAVGAKGAVGSGGGEKGWRDRFATLRHKLEQDTTDLDVMQRELGVLNVQYYDDPVKAMQQGLTRDDINKKTADIEAKKQAIQADQQAIDSAEEDLRKAGGDPGWSR